MASTIAAITTGVGGVVTTADATGNLNLLAGTTTVVALTTAGAAVSGTLSATGITTVAAGSAALPAIVSTTGTADTGLWFPAADTVAASTAGTERLRIDSSGNVGIGTNSPSGKFHVSGGRAYFAASSEQFGLALKYSAATSGVWLGSPGTDAFTVATEGGAERMRIDSSGNVTLQNNISVGGAAPTTSGTGITFPATQSASTNANTLDDYEEGTWTPNVNGASVGSFSTKTGYYVKIGKKVTCWFMCDGGSTGAGGATQYVTNLPFTITTAINNSNLGQMGVNGPATRTLDLMALNANFGVAYVYTGGSQEQTAITFASGCFTYGID